MYNMKKRQFGEGASEIFVKQDKKPKGLAAVGSPPPSGMRRVKRKIQPPKLSQPMPRLPATREEIELRKQLLRKQFADIDARAPKYPLMTQIMSTPAVKMLRNSPKMLYDYAKIIKTTHPVLLASVGGVMIIAIILYVNRRHIKNMYNRVRDKIEFQKRINILFKIKNPKKFWNWMNKK